MNISTPFFLFQYPPNVKGALSASLQQQGDGGRGPDERSEDGYGPGRQEDKEGESSELEEIEDNGEDDGDGDGPNPQQTHPPSRPSVPLTQPSAYSSSRAYNPPIMVQVIARLKHMVQFRSDPLTIEEVYWKEEEAHRKEEEAQWTDADARMREENKAHQSLQEAKRLEAGARQSEAAAQKREAEVKCKEVEVKR